jgi:hypothetical protein
MINAGTTGLSLVVWQGWGALSVIAALMALLAAILSWLLPLPNRSLDRQLERFEDRMALKARLGEMPAFQTYFLTQKRLSEWLMEWFGPPFSAQAFERNLAIAFLFPIALFLVALIANGMAQGRVHLGEVALFCAGFAVIAYVIAAALRNLLEIIERMWTAFGGDPSLAAILARLLLGAFAVMVAFTIAFAIASVFSGDAASAASVLGAMGGGFALAFALTAAFALAGAALFTVVLAIIGVAALAFASQFAFLLFLFFVLIPVVNAGLDWLTWGITRRLMSKMRRFPGDLNGLAAAAGLMLASFAVAAAMMVALAIVLPNAIEIMNRLFALAGLSTFKWRDLVASAANAPWSEGLFVTGMLLTAIAPASTYLIVGLAGTLARFTPGALTAASYLSDHPEVAPAPYEQGPVKLTLILARLWYLAGIAATLAFIWLASFTVSATHAPAGSFFQQVALCSTSWSHGECGWIDRETVKPKTNSRKAR